MFHYASFHISLKIPFTNPNSHTAHHILASAAPSLSSGEMTMHPPSSWPSSASPKMVTAPIIPQNRPWMVGPRQNHQSWTLHNHEQCNYEIYFSCITWEFVCGEVTSQRENAWRWKEEGSRLPTTSELFLIGASPLPGEHCRSPGTKWTMKMPPRDGDTLTG